MKTCKPNPVVDFLAENPGMIDKMRAEAYAMLVQFYGEQVALTADMTSEDPGDWHFQQRVYTNLWARPRGATLFNEVPTLQ